MKLFRIHGIQLSRYVQLRKEESSPINDRGFHLKKLGEEKQFESKGSGRKEIIKQKRKKINKIKNLGFLNQ